MTFSSIRKSIFSRLISFCLMVTFVTSMVITPRASAQGVAGLPEPGTMVSLSSAYVPMMITGLTIHPENPLLMDFIVNTGNTGMGAAQVKVESDRLIKYFLACLTIPENNQWVNLSPYEKDRIIPDDLGATVLGQDMLAQDYLLKQLSASLIYPEKNLGKNFWDKVYTKASQMYGTTQIPLNTFNKVWILPDTAQVYEHKDTVFVVKSHLKVMLDADYLALSKHSSTSQVNSIGSQVVRQVILPAIEEEVNTGKNFAQMRQIYNSMILAFWFKTNLKKALLNQVYTDKSKVNGVNVDDPAIKEKIYQQYLDAYKKGVFNYIKEEVDQNSNQVIPRKYFSGGLTAVKKLTQATSQQAMSTIGNEPGQNFKVFGLTQQAMKNTSSEAEATGVLPRINPMESGNWEVLKLLAEGKQRQRYALRTLFAHDPKRAERFLVSLNEHMDVDFSKNLIDQETLNVLLDLAKDVSLKESIEKMFGGEKINETEHRAVLHIALRNVKRGPSGELVAANGPIMVDGQDVMPKVIEVLKKMESFTKKVQSGQWKGASGKRIKNIINVGIGGSDLGPKMAVEALKPFKAGDVDAYFVSNIDGTAAAELMKKLDPEETLVIIASKTFTTQETMQNAQTLKNWILKAYQGSPLEGNPDIIKKHFVAVSTAKDLVEKFGIDPQNMFEFWDWVGGRYSVWSSIGLSLATYIGFDNFLQFLEGGREADDHFRNQPFEKNIPVLKALLNVWYGNFLGADSFAILPYDQYMSLFPAFAQQFFMESNGKSVGRDGKPVGYNTGLITWGAAGTDGQHSFYQLIHQGTRLVPADFIGIMKSHNLLPGHHEKLFSNFVAQTEALAFGATTEEVRKVLEADPKYKGRDLDWNAMQQTFTGNKPTTSILIDQMTPRTLGNLVSLYEHQIFTEGIIWNIFSFDQWGVQLGKLVADKQVLPFLNGSRSLDELSQSGLSPAAQRTIRKFVEANTKAMKSVDITEPMPLKVDFKTHREFRALPNVPAIWADTEIDLKDAATSEQIHKLFGLAEISNLGTLNSVRFIFAMDHERQFHYAGILVESVTGKGKILTTVFPILEARTTYFRDYETSLLLKTGVEVNLEPTYVKINAQLEIHPGGIFVLVPDQATEFIQNLQKSNNYNEFSEVEKQLSKLIKETPNTDKLNNIVTRVLNFAVSEYANNTGERGQWANWLLFDLKFHLENIEKRGSEIWVEISGKPGWVKWSDELAQNIANDIIEKIQAKTPQPEATGGASTAAMITPDQAREKLNEGGWEGLFDHLWSELSRKFQGQAELLKQKQDRLLDQIDAIDWKEAKRLRDGVIVPGVPAPVIPKEFKVPYEKLGAVGDDKVREIARKEILEAGNTDENESKFAVVLAAGGTGSEFRMDKPKGYLPGTPLSQIPLYAGMVKKIQAAATYYKHKKSFPIVVMTSDITHKMTEQFFIENKWFGMKDRIILVQQGVMPLFDAKQDQPFLNEKGELATGGTGHGDTFDDILVRTEVSEFLHKFGVEAVQYINVDNQLNPIADERLIGYGQKTWDPESKDPRAHIAIGVVKRLDRNDRLAFQYQTDGQWATVSYGNANDDLKNNIDVGDPSFRVAWLKSLSKESPMTPWRIDKKKAKDIDGKEIVVKKIERASDEKPRRAEGPLVELNRADTFEPIKKPDALATTETVATSYLAQSNYWKRRVVIPEIGIQTSDKIALEIAAQEAFYMSDGELNTKLNEPGLNGAPSIKDQINAWLSNPSRKPYDLGGILITEDWQVKFFEKDDPHLYFLNWQDSMIKSPVAPNVDPDILKGKTVLITGGAGYVASGVIYEALQDGSNVVIYDNMLTQERLRILDKISNAYPGRIKVVNGDLADAENLDDTVVKYQPQSVVHLGAYLMAGVSKDLPASYMYNNVVNTMTLLEVMKKRGIKNLVFASSAGVYEGEDFNKFGLLDEKIPPNPKTVYGETKYLMEVLMQAYANDKEKPINFTALRFFNLAGAFYWDEIKEWVGEGHLGPETHMIPRLIKSVLYPGKVSFQINGDTYNTPDGTNIRDYISVRDIGKAILKSLSAGYQAENDGQKIQRSINLGTGTPTSNKEVVNALRKLLLKRGIIQKPEDLPDVIGKPREGGEPAVLRASSEEATKQLGWRASEGLDRIMETAWDFHVQEKNNGSLDLNSQFPEKLTGISEATFRKMVLDKIDQNKSITDEIKSEILLRLLVRNISPDMEEVNKGGFKGEMAKLEAMYRSIVDGKTSLFKNISTEGFVPAVMANDKRTVSELIKFVIENSRAGQFTDDPNSSRLEIAQALDTLIKHLPNTITAAMSNGPITNRSALGNVNQSMRGGIDLSSRILKMQSEGQKVDITFNPAMMAQFERGNFSGVRIKILDVTRINLVPLLGLNEYEGAGQLAKV